MAVFLSKMYMEDGDILTGSMVNGWFGVTTGSVLTNYAENGNIGSITELIGGSEYKTEFIYNTEGLVGSTIESFPNYGNVGSKIITTIFTYDTNDNLISTFREVE